MCHTSLAVNTMSSWFHKYFCVSITLLMWVTPLAGAEESPALIHGSTGAVWAGKKRICCRLHPIRWEQYLRGAAASSALPNVSIYSISSRVRGSTCKCACRTRADSCSVCNLLQLFFLILDVFGSSWSEQGSEGSIKSSKGKKES